jgi:O-antigen ligase
MTQSATGKILLATIAIYVVAMQSLRRFGSKDKGVALIVIATLLTVVAVVGVSYSTELSYLLGKDPTLTGRTGIWRATMVSVMKRPVLGYGYMAFWRGFEGEAANVSLANGWSSVYAHSGFMDVLTELGGLGLLLFIVSFVRALRDSATCLRGKDSSFVNWALCIVLLTVLLNVDEVSILVSYHLLWILYIIACIGLSERAVRARRRLKL